MFEFDLVADPGYLVNLASFDMANWGNYSQTISSLSLQDGNGNNLYFASNVLVPGTGHTHYTFTTATAPTVKILFDASVGVDADDVSMDNITFSQQSVPDFTWKGPGGGSYNLASNWTNNIVPNGVDATANFLENIAAPSTVTLDSPVTLGTLNFSSTRVLYHCGGFESDTSDKQWQRKHQRTFREP